jgi:hypothetical protein
MGLAPGLVDQVLRSFRILQMGSLEYLPLSNVHQFFHLTNRDLIVPH